MARRHRPSMRGGMVVRLAKTVCAGGEPAAGPEGVDSDRAEGCIVLTSAARRTCHPLVCALAGR